MTMAKYMRSFKFPKLALLLGKISGGAVVLFAAYSALLCVPQPFFSFSGRANSLVLHSDRPVSASPAERWRQVLFFNKEYGVGGVAPYPVSANVFLRDARIEDDRLIGPSGVAVSGDRTLDYFIAHEITTSLPGVR
jgi:hypothetical protein